VAIKPASPKKSSITVEPIIGTNILDELPQHLLRGGTHSMNDQDRPTEKIARQTSAVRKNSATSKNSSLTPTIQNKIGQQLRALYSETLNEGVPDRFAELLRKLDENSGSKGSE
jgi:hypothetical protein